MSTTGIESWAVDLKDIGAIYPFQGSEGLLVILGIICWIAWHVWQLRFEEKTQAKQVRNFGDNENLKNIVGKS